MSDMTATTDLTRSAAEVTQVQSTDGLLQHYSVSLVLSTGTSDDNGQHAGIADYERPIITISYQAERLAKPVEVAHIYVQTQNTDPQNYADRQIITNLLRGYVANIREQLNGFNAPQEQLFTHQHVNGFYANVTTLFIGPTPTGAQALKDAGYFAHAQIFTPHKAIITPPPLLAGYDLFIPLKAVSHLCTLPTCAPAQFHELGSGYSEHGNRLSFAQTIAALAQRNQLPNQAALVAFKPPHTQALGDFSASGNAELLPFPNRGDVAKERKRRGIFSNSPAPTKASQLG